MKVFGNVSHYDRLVFLQFLLVHLCVTQSVVVSLLLMVDTSEEFFYFDFALQLHHAIHDSLWAWRTSRYENIDGNNLINSSYHMITALERTARNSTSTHRNNVLGFCHFIV